ncbi:unnamed protein product [Clonostachys rosea]|uniref:Uncharacterized protein n=1 Tax=Bionectria ochroleuca TaxID=29856 RepID=A0ABY6UQL1_BIOOC|nr:unnamed protein product [Clonostachys rosea]
MTRTKKTDVSGDQITRGDTESSNFVAVPRPWGVAGREITLTTNQGSSVMERWLAEAPADAPFHAMAMVSSGSAPADAGTDAKKPNHSG